MSQAEDESLGILFSDVTRLFWRRLESEFAAMGLDFTSGEARVLIMVDEQPGLRQGQLAERLHIEPMSLVGFLDRLEGRGLVERAVDPHDRRARLVHPTASGQAVIDHIRRASASVRAGLVEGLDVSEVATLRRLLQRVRSNLIAAKGDRA